ncbi:MAG: molybdopterin-dependent oxidoreductase [Chitinophagales bacterium]|nr:molybdopterin-dependent oxidoreductase [Chitinophagales bacterium]
MSKTEQSKKQFSRRKFLIRASVGAGVMIGVGYLSCSPLRRTLATTANEIDMAYNNKASAITWFEVTADNKIILHSPKVEMGQGIFTGMAQLVAEELGVDINKIEVVHASTNGRPVDPRSTGGSDTMSGLWQPLRELAAKMREMLKSNASELLGIPVEQLAVNSDGLIEGGGQSITFGEIVQQATEWKEPKKVQLKDRKDFKVIGKAVPRVDLEAKVMGAPIFGMDASIPGMLYAHVVRPSKIDTVFVSADVSKAQGMPGVIKIVEEKDFVAAVAETKTQAIAAAKEIEVSWKTNKVWEQADVDAMIKVGQGEAVEIQRAGAPKKMLSGEDVIEVEYTSPIGAHAQIEPNGAVADVQSDKAIIQISTQVAKYTQAEVAKRLGMKEEQVEIKSTFLGGGFGRRLHTPNAMQAAAISKAVGKPVHVFFDRMQEFQHDTFRPPTHHVLKAKLDENGDITAIEHNVSSGDVAFGSVLFPSFLEGVIGADIGAWRGGMIQYTGIPNYRAVSWRVKLPFATSWWRSLGLLANTFAIESFMDELAHKAGKDPVQFRLGQIKDNERGRRLKGVIKAAADKAVWGKELPTGHAMGFAASTDANTPVAQVVEISIEDGRIKVHKVTCAIDPGIVINPDAVRAQCEGAIIMGLSAAMFEKMEIKNGAVGPTIYGAYKMALMKHAPKEIDVVLLEGGDKPSGVGEPPLGPIGAAIGNAFFSLTGERLRNLPLSS